MEEARTSVRYLQRPEGRIGYDVTGDGPLVICLPGMGELRSAFRLTVPALVAAGFRVATVDLRGHGDSDATFSRYDDVAAGQDVLALIEELDGPAILIGNSMGAGAAVWAAAERPDIVAGLGLIGPFVRDIQLPAATRMMLRLAMGGPWATRAWLSYLPKLYPGRRPADLSEHVAAIATSMREPGHAKAFRATTRTSHAPAEQRLGDVRAPALVVMGAGDPDFRDPAAEATWISDQLGAQQLVVPDAGHYPQVEYPELVNPPLVRFCHEAVAVA